MSSYFAMWIIAAVVCAATAAAVGVPHGDARWRSATAIAMLATVMIGASKTLYVVETVYRPFDDYVPHALRSVSHGFRIPGGILALPFAMPIVCRALRLDWRTFGDRLVFLPSIAIVFVRLGCLMNGCCFGRISKLPWAVSFAPGSWAYWYQRAHGLIPVDAPGSLPVHPLQLYFLLASIGSVVTLYGLRSLRMPAGRLQLIGYSLFFASTALLEPLRENRLELNLAITRGAGLVCVAALIVAVLRDLRAPLLERSGSIVDEGLLNAGVTYRGAE